MSARENDIERGLEPAPNARMDVPANFQPQPRPQLTRASTYLMSPGPRSVMLPQDNTVLQAFRFHIGIHNDPSLISTASNQPRQIDGAKSRSIGDLVAAGLSSLTSSDDVMAGSDRPAPNVGIYHRVINAEKKYHREYKVFSLLINGALGLQIIFAAALTALGAGNGPHSAVTAFGALNTVLAGFLTFLKGSGLPNRLKYYENEWSKVREYIEQRERDFAGDYHGTRLGWEGLEHEIQIIEGMYESTRKDIEANTPDSYVSMSNAIKSISSNRNEAGGQIPSIARNLSRMTHKTNETEESHPTGTTYNGRYPSAMSGIDQRISKGYGDLEKQAIISITEVANGAETRLRDTGKYAEQRVSSAGHSVTDGLQRSVSIADSRFHDAQNSAQQRAHDTQSSLTSRFNDAQTSAQNRFSNAQTSAYQRAADTQNSVHARIDDVQHQISDTHAANQSRLGDVQHRLDDTAHLADSKVRDMEEKIALAAEKAVERVLQMTKHQQG